MARVRVLIYGTGQTGNMVASILELHDDVEIVGFVDDDEATWDGTLRGYEVLGGRAFVDRGEGFDKVAVAVGQVEPRRELAEWVRGQSIPQQSVIHPSASIPRDSVIGEGTIIGAGTTLYVNPIIGRNVFIGPHVVVSHDSVIGDYALLSVGSVIGARVDVAPGAFVGAGASVMPPGWGVDERLTVGEDSIVGVGAVVIRDVEPRSIVVGVPAKLLRYREEA
jgi:sugar O-acyltransferase (sialic acid O-acetyltransferase NeuD family)